MVGSLPLRVIRVLVLAKALRVLLSLPQKHIKEHHEEVRERPCPHPGCNKVFMIDRYLQRHVKLIHTGMCPALPLSSVQSPWVADGDWTPFRKAQGCILVHQWFEMDREEIPVPFCKFIVVRLFLSLLLKLSWRVASPCCPGPSISGGRRESRVCWVCSAVSFRPVCSSSLPGRAVCGPNVVHFHWPYSGLLVK